MLDKFFDMDINIELNMDTTKIAITKNDKVIMIDFEGLCYKEVEQLVNSVINDNYVRGNERIKKII
jgi:hypothetical protein